jgi:hypothetical protein
MEFDQSKRCCKSEEQKHRVEEDEPRDAEPSDICPFSLALITTCYFLLTTQDTQSYPMSGISGPSHLTRRPPCNRYEGDPKTREHDPHRCIWHVVGVRHARLEVEAAGISRQQTSQTDQHFPKRRVDVKVEISVDVV